MADFLVRNSLNPNKAVLFGITYKQIIPKGEEGEALWLIEVATDELDFNDLPIRPELLNLRTLDSLDMEIQAAVSRISSKIDWSPLINDSRSPYIDYVYPSGNNVPLDASVVMHLNEVLPAAGIDIGSISITINDFDITNELEITGDPYNYIIKWTPLIRVKAEY